MIVSSTPTPSHPVDGSPVSVEGSPVSASEPRADRPDIPGGYLQPRLLAWAWAEARLEQSANYWIATVTPRGRPHARPVWGVWHEGALYFGTGARIATNLAHGAAVSVNLESGDECVIVEGRAEPVAGLSDLGPVLARYEEKYHWKLEPAPGEIWRVRPRVAFGWLCDGTGLDGGVLYSQTATRWTFEDQTEPAGQE